MDVIVFRGADLECCSIPRFFESYTDLRCVNLNDTQENDHSNHSAEWVSPQEHNQTAEWVNVSHLRSDTSEVHCTHYVQITDLRLDPYYISVSDLFRPCFPSVLSGVLLPRSTATI